MAQGNTGTDDNLYNLVSVLYHALQGAETYDKYISDAGDDQELATFMRAVKDEGTRRADRAKELLARRLSR